MKTGLTRKQKVTELYFNEHDGQEIVRYHINKNKYAIFILSDNRTYDTIIVSINILGTYIIKYSKGGCLWNL